jgi:hypothetical protein
MLILRLRDDVNSNSALPIFEEGKTTLRSQTVKNYLHVKRNITPTQYGIALKKNQCKGLSRDNAAAPSPS